MRKISVLVYYIPRFKNESTHTSTRESLQMREANEQIPESRKLILEPRA